MTLFTELYHSPRLRHAIFAVTTTSRGTALYRELRESWLPASSNRLRGTSETLDCEIRLSSLSLDQIAGLPSFSLREVCVVDIDDMRTKAKDIAATS